MDDRMRLIDYINTASDLAESLQNDIIKGSTELSSRTVLKLSKFVAAAERFRSVTDLIEATTAEEKQKLN